MKLFKKLLVKNLLAFVAAFLLLGGIQILTNGSISTIVTVNAASKPGQVKNIKRKGVKKYETFYYNGKLKKYDTKYNYGIKFSWNTVKNATGYEIYRYESAKKCWTRIKVTKKTSYTLTYLSKGVRVKLKIRAYKQASDGTRTYGKFSEVQNFKVKYMYAPWDPARDYFVKFYDKYAAEDAFVIQNKYRTEAGVAKLKWSDVLYELCVMRLDYIQEKRVFSHDGKSDSIEDYLLENYDVSKYTAETLSISCGENLVGNPCTPQEAMRLWKNSKGHYFNITYSHYTYGAIANVSNSDYMDNIYLALFFDDYADGMKFKTKSNTIEKIDYSFFYNAYKNQ